jgi:6-phosphogluconolactonase
MIFKSFLAIMLASTLMINMLIAQNNDSNRYFNLLVGTYTSGKSEGIYVYEFDTQTGKFSHKYTAKDIENPSFVTTSPDCKNVYAVNELSGDKPGSVSAYKFDAKSGEMTFLNNQPSAGGDP